MAIKYYSDISAQSVELTGSLTFTQSSAAFVNHNVTSQSVKFRLSNSSALDVTPFEITPSYMVSTVDMYFGDSNEAIFGTGNDLKIKHDGSNSLIRNFAGDFYILNAANDKDIIFQSDDGAGGTATYFSLDGSLATHDGAATTALYTVWPDKSRIALGTGSDLQIYHNATNSNIENFTGTLQIVQTVDDEDIVFRCDDGSGGHTPYITLDGGLGFTTIQKHVRWQDGIIARFGNSDDGSLYHSGGHFYMGNNTGDIIITNNTDDGDITFKSDDGSGGVTTYMYLDGGNNNIKFQKDTNWIDNEKAIFGTGSDLQILSDGNDGFINNETNHFYITNNANDCDLVLRSDDGSGGVTAYLTLDGSNTTIKIEKNTFVTDNTLLGVGDGSDLRMSHNGTNSFIDNYTGDFYIRQRTDDKDLKLQCDDGSGGVTDYITLDGSVGYTIASKAIRALDSVNLQLGTSADFTMQHNGSNTVLQNFTGDLQITQGADDGDIIFSSDDGSGGVTPYITLDGVNTMLKIDQNTRVADSKYLALGSGSDLRLTHDSTNSLIQNFGGDLVIEQRVDDKDIIFKCDDGSGGTETYFFLDGSASSGSPYTVFPDNSLLAFGTGNDMIVSHNATNSLIQNNTGDLYIMNQADDKDIIFQSDDGSGGTETYFFLDGSANGSSPLTVFPDNSWLGFGSASADAYIHFNGTNFYMDNYNGAFYIRNFADDKDIILMSDNGSGGTAAYLTLDGSTKTVDVDVPIEINDHMLLNSKQDYNLPAQGTRMRLLQIADHTLCRVYLETSENSYHQPIVLDIFYRAQFSGSKPQIVRSESYEWHAHSNDVIFTSDQAGTAGADSYIYAEKVAYSTGRPLNIRKIEVFDGTVTLLDGSTTDTNGGTDETIVSTFAELNLGDSDHLKIGDSSDLDLYHNATNSFIENWTGDLYIRNNANDKDVIFQSDDGSGGIATYLTLDGSVTRTIFNKHTQIVDGQAYYVGTGTDGGFYASSDNVFLEAMNGDMTIVNYTNDKDIIFKCDDGSGGVETYFFLDGSASGGNPVTIFPDSSTLRFGNSGDLQLYHDAANSYIAQTGTGDLYIRNTTDDKDIIFQSDDGSGGVQTYFFLDGSVNSTVFPDSSKLYFGTSHDSYIEHDGTNTYLSNATGKLIIRNTLDDGDIELVCDDGSGGITAYLTLDGGNTDIDFHKNTHHLDNVYLKIGSATGGDLQIYHNASHSLISNQTGNLYIRNQTNDGDIIFQGDDGAGGDATYFTIDGSQATHDGSATTTLVTQWPDNSKIYVGSSGDGRFWHNGSHTYLQNTTGDLIIQNFADDKDIIFKSDDGSGGTAEYFRLDGSAGTVEIAKATNVNGNVTATRVISDILRDTNENGHLVTTVTNASNTATVVGNTATCNTLTLGAKSGGSVTTQANVSITGTLTVGVDDTGYDVKFYGATAGSFMLWDESDDSLELTDSTYIKLGDSGDFKMWHDGSNTYLSNEGVGHIYIQNTADDKDIIFKSDNGSGGTTTYFSLDGSHTETVFSEDIRFADNKVAKFGASNDLQIHHNGSNSYITQAGTGDLYIMNTTNDEDIIFVSDDGAGGNGEYFRLDGSAAEHDGSATTALFTQFPDKSIASFGSSNDLRLYHDGSNSQIFNYNGHLYIKNHSNDSNIAFECDDTSGGLAEYFRLDGALGYSVASKHILFGDGVKTRFGNSADLEIQHDGSDSIVNNNTGHLYFTNLADDRDIYFRSDDGSGGVAEYFRLDGSSKLNVFSQNVVIGSDTPDDVGGTSKLSVDVGSSQTVGLRLQNGGTDGVYFRRIDSGGEYQIQTTSGNGNSGILSLQSYGGSVGIGNVAPASTFHVTGTFQVGVDDTGHDVIFYGATSGAYLQWDESGDALELKDSTYLYLGTHNDLQLYHDGSNSYIQQSGTGDLYIQNGVNDKDIILRSDDGLGGQTAYITLDGSQGFTTVQKDMQFADDVGAKFGAGNDLRIDHNGSDSSITNNTGDLVIKNNTDDGDIIFKSDDGSGGTQTYLTIDGGITSILAYKDILMANDGNNGKIKFGASQDLQIYHDGSHSRIVDTGTGHLVLNATDFVVNNSGDTKNMIIATDGGSVSLYYNANKKFETTAYGAKTTYSPTSNTDGDVAGDIVHLGETTTVAGKIYYYKSDGAWGLVDANAASTCSGLLAVALGTSSSTNGMLLRGMATIANDPGAVGDTLFASTTAGEATATAPSGSGDIVRVIGYCLNATNGQIWFNPDGAFVEVA